MLVYFYNKMPDRQDVNYGISFYVPSCQEIPFGQYKLKPLADFNLYTLELTSKNEKMLIPKINTLIKEFKNGNSIREGIAISFTTSTYDGYISLLTLLTENKIDRCFYLDDCIYYIPIKKYCPQMLHYTYIDYKEPELKRIGK